MGGFSLVELLCAVGVMAIGFTSVAAIYSHSVRTLRRSTVASFASQLIQERMEQFRRASWTDITCDYPPADDEPGNESFENESNGDPPPPYRGSIRDTLSNGLSG